MVLKKSTWNNKWMELFAPSPEIAAHKGLSKKKKKKNFSHKFYDYWGDSSHQSYFTRSTPMGRRNGKKLIEYFPEDCHKGSWWDHKEKDFFQPHPGCSSLVYHIDCTAGISPSCKELQDWGPEQRGMKEVGYIQWRSATEVKCWFCFGLFGAWGHTPLSLGTSPCSVLKPGSLYCSRDLSCSWLVCLGHRPMSGWKQLFGCYPADGTS